MPDLGTQRRVDDQTVKSCLLDEWYVQVARRLVMEPKRKREAFNRSINYLSANEFIGINEQLVWLIG
jgi:hypothetical protein